MKPQPDRPHAALPADAHAAFRDLADEIAAVRDDDILHFDLDLRQSAAIALEAAARIGPLVPQLALLPGFDIAAARDLRQYALATLYANVIATEAARTDERLFAESSRLRDLLLGAAELLAQCGLCSDERVAEIRSSERLVSCKDPGPPMLYADDPERTRSRAFILLVRKYKECRHGVEYLRWNHRDADEVAPSFFDDDPAEDADSCMKAITTRGARDR